MQDVSHIDMQLGEIAGLVQALIFMQEEADDARRESLRGATVAMLYVITDKLRTADRSVAAAYRQQPGVELH